MLHIHTLYNTILNIIIYHKIDILTFNVAMLWRILENKFFFFANLLNSSNTHVKFFFIDISYEFCSVLFAFLFVFFIKRTILSFANSFVYLKCSSFCLIKNDAIIFPLYSYFFSSFSLFWHFISFQPNIDFVPQFPYWFGS